MSCSSTSSSFSSSSSTSSMWADLPNDILESLVRSLQSSFDRLRFGAVCRSWREVAAAAKRNATSRSGVPPLPILTFRDPAEGVSGGGGAVEAPEEVNDDVAGATPLVTRCFYSLSEDKVYHLQVASESRNWRCFGSSRGWLGMIDLSAKPFLFDPLTGARVDLPSLATLTRLILLVKRRKKDGATVYIYKEPNDRVRSGSPLTATEVRDKFIHRLTLSSSPLDSNCIVMTTVSGYRLPAYTRPGDDSWVEVPDLRSDSWQFRDIVYHEGTFYALGDGEEIIAITFGHSKSPSVEVLVPMIPFPYFSHQWQYLVVLPSGDLLRVNRYQDLESDFEETDLFELHKLKVDNKSATSTWVEVEDIGDCCLFLGTAHSMSLPAFEVFGKYRANYIFFTDDRRFYEGRDFEGLDYGMYEIEEGTVERFCHIDARCVVPQPMWITPRF